MSDFQVPCLPAMPAGSLCDLSSAEAGILTSHTELDSEMRRQVSEASKGGALVGHARMDKQVRLLALLPLRRSPTPQTHKGVHQHTLCVDSAVSAQSLPCPGRER